VCLLLVLFIYMSCSNTPASPHGESGWAAWQQRRRHFFVLTAAGKPVYSRHGDEQALAGEADTPGGRGGGGI